MQRPHSGFTLIELMVVMAIIGLMMSGMAYVSRSLLPQTRLAASATAAGAALQEARLAALFTNETLLFVYDLDQEGWESFYPYERDEAGENLGPGLTLLREFRRVDPGIALRAVRLPGGEWRDEGRVVLDVSPEGRILPHELLLDNPEYPDTEVLTVRVSGLVNRYEVLQGAEPQEIVEDATFR